MQKPRVRRRSDGKWVIEHPAKGFSGQGDTIAEARTDMAYHYWRARAMQLREESSSTEVEVSILRGKVKARDTVNNVLCMALAISLCFHILPHLPF